ncbi:c-type cytochrome biogenesis protein CcsB [Cellulomonas sp. Y8]|uniref:c-type cytochrome biogenesis protein CcsB n=1 Tax=Cellulomonas sp. Y8 TaxID=2591145 RepID=UPI003D71BA79
MPIGDLSTLFVWGAVTAYAVALVAYATALARVAEAAARAQRRAVAVGVGAAGPATTARPGPSSAEPGRAAGIARSTATLATALLLGGVVLRGVAAGRWPTANMYEFTIVGILVAAVVFLAVRRTRTLPFVGVLVTGIAVLSLVVALNSFYLRADAVQPALQSYWLVVHVSIAIAATGIFTVAFATSVLQVLQDARESGRSRLESPWRAGDEVRRSLRRWRITGPAWSWLRTVPSAVRLEALSFRLNAIAFVLWTLTLIGGAIWAEQAWGRYWGWDPKEVATFVAWVVYAAYLHARTTRGWQGRRAAYLVYVGYAVVVANFTVVNLFVNGKHSYSGI